MLTSPQPKPEKKEKDNAEAQRRRGFAEKRGERKEEESNYVLSQEDRHGFSDVHRAAIGGDD
jgi:hypothetical protein